MSIPTQRQGRPTLKFTKADGAVANPLILLEGDEGSGKTHETVLLSRSQRVGAVYGIELGENGRLREYGGTLPGCSVGIIEHDGSYQRILEQVTAAKEEAARAKAAGEKPVVLAIDSFSFFWAGLCEWVNQRARQSTSGKRKLAEDDNAEIDPGRHLWNDASTRYNRVANILKTFPGIVVLTARGSWVSMTDPRTGQPFKDGRKEYSVECNKRLPYDASVWVRMTRGGEPQVVACKSGHLGKKYVKKLDGSEPNTETLVVPKDRDLLDYLVFDVLKYDSLKAGDNELKMFSPGDLDEHERVAEAAAEAESGGDAPPTAPMPQQQANGSARPARQRPAPPVPPVALKTAVQAAACDDAQVLRGVLKWVGDQRMGGFDVRSAVDAAAETLQLPAGSLTLVTWLNECIKRVEANGLSVDDQVRVIAEEGVPA